MQEWTGSARLLLALLAGIGLSLAMAATIHAAILVVDLAERPPQARLTGVQEEGRAGSALAVGDLNGDGQTDLIVGAPGESPGTELTYAGRVYVFFDPPSLVGEVSLSEADLILEGDRAQGGAGSALAVGDLNDDGVDDLIVGAPAIGVSVEAGRVYILYGRSNFPSSLALSSADVIISGAQAGAWTGYALAAGDLDGDGKDDLAVGAPAFTTVVGTPITRTGRVYAFLSRQGVPAGTLSVSEADLTVSGLYAFAATGTSLAVADVNGDGTYGDLIIGAPFDDPFARPRRGEAYVFFGSTALPGDRSVVDADVRVEGTWTKDWLGRTVRGGDVNGDGVADLIVGATGDQEEGEGTSSIYVFYGGGGLVGEKRADAADVLLRSGGRGEQSGYWLAVGNLDGDGRADLVAGARMVTSDGRFEAGRAYVFYGSRLTTTQDLYADADVVIEAPVERGRMGSAVALGGFLDTAYDGLALGAPKVDQEKGAVYLMEMPPRGVRLQPDYDHHLEEIGGEAVYTHTLANLCILTDTFDLSYQVVEGSGWSHQLQPAQVTVAGLGTATVYFRVTAPAGLGRAVDVSVVTATSRADPSAVDIVTDRSVVGWDIYLPLVLRKAF